MIYLLSQIVLALLLAAIVGGALGWLLHRTTQVREAGQLRNAIQRQRQQMAQLNSEISMLTDDYDELQRQTHDEIAELREANQQIPRLNSNLEKSQLLVSQMLKRNESQVRDLTTQNQTLTQKLKELEAKEQVLKRQQAELDSARRELGIADPQSTSTDAGADAEQESTTEPGEPSAASADEASATAASVSGESVEKSTAQASASDESVEKSTAQAPVSDESVEKSAAQASASDESVEKSTAQAPASDEAVERGAAPVVSTGGASSELAASSDADGSADKTATIATSETPRPSSVQAPIIASTRNVSSWASAPLQVDETTVTSEVDSSDTSLSEPVRENSSVIFLDADTPLPESKVDTAEPTDGTVSEEDSELDPFDQVIEIDDQLLEEIDSDMDTDDFLDGLDDALGEDDTVAEEASSFDPVEQQDDLQQIGGIGPATEKALNELGITSYAQLAKLKHHEIETIANALQIVPDRIESDDWVGNARRQLEDVLEEL